jgi:hypothetical protein
MIITIYTIFLKTVITGLIIVKIFGIIADQLKYLYSYILLNVRLSNRQLIILEWLNSLLEDCRDFSAEYRNLVLTIILVINFFMIIACAVSPLFEVGCSVIHYIDNIELLD